MTSMNALNIAGVDFYTMRGTVQETRSSGLFVGAPRSFTATVDVESIEQEDMIRFVMHGYLVAVTMSDLQSIAKATIKVASLPAVQTDPRKPFQVQIEIQEII